MKDRELVAIKAQCTHLKRRIDSKDAAIDGIDEQFDQRHEARSVRHVHAAMVRILITPVVGIGRIGARIR